MDGPIDRWTNGPTDGQIPLWKFEDACKRLKKRRKEGKEQKKKKTVKKRKPSGLIGAYPACLKNL